MTAPAFVIRLPLEGRPLLSWDCLTEGEWDRLIFWLDANPARVALLRAALALVEQERAA